jgi:hypothetical protein
MALPPTTDHQRISQTGESSVLELGAGRGGHSYGILAQTPVTTILNFVIRSAPQAMKLSDWTAKLARGVLSVESIPFLRPFRPRNASCPRQGPPGGIPECCNLFAPLRVDTAEEKRIP